MSNVFSVEIKFVDGIGRWYCYIAESESPEDLPEGFVDEDIFFYGMSESDIHEAIESGKPCEDEWVITKFNEKVA